MTKQHRGNVTLATVVAKRNVMQVVREGDVEDVRKTLMGLSETERATINQRDEEEQLAPLHFTIR